MVEQLFSADVGVHFYKHRLRFAGFNTDGIPPALLGTRGDVIARASPFWWSAVNVEEEKRDALSPMHDESRLSPHVWYIVEAMYVLATAKGPEI